MKSRLVFAVVVLVACFGWMRTLAPTTVHGPASYVMIRGVSMLPTYHFGDLVVTHKQSAYHKGDIVAYKVPKGQFGAGIVVIHRIVGGNGATGFDLRGDNNNFVDDWHPKQADVVGKAWVLVPGAGLVLAFLHAPVPMASLAAGIAVALVLVPAKKKTSERRPLRLGPALVITMSAVFVLTGGIGQVAAAKTASCAVHANTEAELVNLEARCPR